MSTFCDELRVAIYETDAELVRLADRMDALRSIAAAVVDHEDRLGREPEDIEDLVGHAAGDVQRAHTKAAAGRVEATK